MYADRPVDQTPLRRRSELIVLDVTDHAPLEDDVGGDETGDDEDERQARDDHPEACGTTERARGSAGSGRGHSTGYPLACQAGIPSLSQKTFW